ncbi:hypothetical protein DLS44_10385, partial [Staphylococcus pseudintermedius]|uniref:hypothetical protein n=1 Tax=Staphylococcus pseudintermedius TaxID=283734 RepID=UPI0010EF9641
VFASDFLQIPLRNGHPCLSLTVPTTKPVTDFHRQDVTHAGRTEKKKKKARGHGDISLAFHVLYD